MARATSLLTAILVLSGCTEKAEPANDVDEVRRAALVAALWLDPTSSSPGRPAITGPDRPYERPYARWSDRTTGTPTDVVGAHVHQARAVGWVPVYGLCSGLGPDETAAGEPFTRADEIVVHLARALPDRSPAYVEVSARESTADQVEVSLEALALYHLDTAEPPPVEEVVVESLLCLDPDRDGPETLGVEMPLHPTGYTDAPPWQ